MMHEGMEVVGQLAIERRVSQKLREFGIPLNARIPIEKIIQKFDASIASLPHMKAKFGVEAAIRRIRLDGTGKKFRVLVDSEVIDGGESYYRIVLAEEAAHLLTDINTLLTVKTIDDFVEIHRHPSWLERERNREAIGRAFLAPKELLELVVKQNYERAILEVGFDRSPFMATFLAGSARDLLMPIDHLNLRLTESPFDLLDRLEFSRAKRRKCLQPDVYDNTSLPTSQLELDFLESLEP